MAGVVDSMMAPDRDRERNRMVDDQLAARGIRDARVLAAFRKVPRHLFVLPEREDQAYEDRPLEIGMGQTISQPYIVACMTEALELAGGERVLEVGTGSGYQTAILLELGARVWSIERFPELSGLAAANLERAGYSARLRVGDGTLGWPEEAPFDRIVVTAGAPDLPLALLAQLREGGAMVVPVGSETEQELVLVRREDGLVKRKKICGCVFVKLVGKEGW
jgi:protein-L-isoaspartate(D-aspartate) O-methyltransferase